MPQNHLWSFKNVRVPKFLPWISWSGRSRMRPNGLSSSQVILLSDPIVNCSRPSQSGSHSPRYIDCQPHGLYQLILNENSRIAPLTKNDICSVYSEQNSVVMTHHRSLARTLPLVSVIVPLLLVPCHPWHHCYPNSWSRLRKLSPYTYKDFCNWCWALGEGVGDLWV